MKDIEGYKAIYLSPDCTPEERDSRRKLVEQLKQKRLSDSDNLYYIRRGGIVRVNKE